MRQHRHSVHLVDDKCIGCTNCIKRCPTEAIRVRSGKAVIIDEKCIDCGLCIKVCRNHAKKATTEPVSIIKKYKYKVAIPAPAIYGQFKNVTDPNVILTAIKNLGFDEVFEVSRAAEMVTEATKKIIAERQLVKPIISSACPAVIKLICSRFPSLINNILPVIPPIEVAAITAKNYLVQHGVNPEDIGIFFISPCAAKNTYIKSPLGINKTEIDAVISIQDIYIQLRNIIRMIDEPEILATSTYKGIDWALTGGESKCVNIDNAIAVDGIENVIKILEEIENGQLEDVDFIEGLACTGGCVGGPLAVVNNFVAKNTLRRIESTLKASAEVKRRDIQLDDTCVNYTFTEPLKAGGYSDLDNSLEGAIKKLEKIEELYSKLPQIDCGSCGAPTCRTLAQDIVLGNANEEDCVFMLREKVKQLAESMVDLSSKLPQTILRNSTK